MSLIRRWAKELGIGRCSAVRQAPTMSLNINEPRADELVPEPAAIQKVAAPIRSHANKSSNALDEFYDEEGLYA